MFVVHPDAAVSLAMAIHNDRVAAAQRNHVVSAAYGRPMSAPAGRALVRAGEWLKYSVKVQSAGAYTVELAATDLAGNAGAARTPRRLAGL